MLDIRKRIVRLCALTPGLKMQKNSLNLVEQFLVSTFALVVLSVLCLAGCSESNTVDGIAMTTADSSPYYFWETPRYEAKENDFKYSHEQAIDLLYQHISQVNNVSFEDLSNHGAGLFHYLIISDEYVFSFPHKMKGIYLNSYRVDGNTGEIRTVYGQLLTPTMQKEKFGQSHDKHIKI